MSKFDQGGAELPLGGPKTKKALREAARENPGAVYLYSTSAFGGWSGYADALPDGMTFNVVGPDPYTKRNWFASVKRTERGVTVS